MKKQLLLGATALSVATLGITAQEAKAFDLTACPSLSPITTATECSYITNPLSGSINDKAFDSSTLSNSTPPGQKVVNVNNVNEVAGPATGFFGITDWTEADKLDSPGEAGATSLAGINGTYDTVMAVFKSGQNTTLVGYLLDGSDGFAWTNPWGALGITQAQGISHITFYGSNQGGGGCTDPNGCDPIPTPAAVLPVLGGLFGAASRRKKEEENA
ncbi:hypothetical protein Lepto7376_0747 [[Leptolyngbya] sp. PCC 7376]|uniref:PTPA-CTERM sorting domain-containing protein n=1 Tax=[Leptolyngbya] sp. PCC 7376 TaxID=111781 RepID=UPI00029F3D3C|nr:PTPA-CTERM sorting domain-containing protein [[Leptolyngbya] sp. PCC 7376]AFY37145.1 hypothetical protein Lepto7376_0747 [[Leptolyngbya] sp. PCC 7376]